MELALSTSPKGFQGESAHIAAVQKHVHLSLAALLILKSQIHALSQKEGSAQGILCVGEEQRWNPSFFGRCDHCVAADQKIRSGLGGFPGLFFSRSPSS